MTEPLHIAFFGSSLVSAYWNGAATYYRGIVEALHTRGHNVVFYEPDAFQRQEHRDLRDVSYARSVVYEPDVESARQCLREAHDADVVVKCSGVGVLDDFLEEAVLELRKPDRKVVFWDVDAPATLERVQQNPNDPFLPLIADYDMILTYGGGDPVIRACEQIGAACCVPIYNAVNPAMHHPAPKSERFEADLAFCGNRMPDRETRVAEFFFRPAALRLDRQFLLGGNGWDDRIVGLPNVRYVGHVYTADHNAFNTTPLAVLNVCRESMARFGYSPATRIFEAAGAGACIITDNWEGLDLFLDPKTECIAVDDGEAVAHALDALTPDRARRIGTLARQRVLAEHTYTQRARQVEQCFFSASHNPRPTVPHV